MVADLPIGIASLSDYGRVADQQKILCFFRCIFGNLLAKQLAIGGTVDDPYRQAFLLANLNPGLERCAQRLWANCDHVLSFRRCPGDETER